MDQIGIRECARRLGVSDTAVHKAIKAGRVSIVGRTAASNRPLVGWPRARDEWMANTNEAHRTHILPGAVVAGNTPPPAMRARAEPPAVAGSKSKDKAAQPGARAKPPGPAKRADVPRETAPPPDVLPPQASAPLTPEPAAGAPSYAQSRAIREAYQARLAKLEYEEKSGKLVAVDQVKADAFRAARALRDALLNISGRIAHQLAHEKDPARISARIDGEIREALRAVAGGQP